MPFAEAVEASAARGHEMTVLSMEDNGWMAAVMAPPEVVQEALRSLDGYVVAANINSRTQCVIGGETEAVRRAIEVFTAKGVQAVRLPVSHAFHTRIVAPASKPARRAARPPADLAAAARWWPTSPAASTRTTCRRSRNCSMQQIAAPVQWVKGLETLYAEGVRTFVEVGPEEGAEGVHRRRARRQARRRLAVHEPPEAGRAHHVQPRAVRPLRRRLGRARRTRRRRSECAGRGDRARVAACAAAAGTAGRARPRAPSRAAPRPRRRHPPRPPGFRGLHDHEHRTRDRRVQRARADADAGPFHDVGRAPWHRRPQRRAERLHCRQRLRHRPAGRREARHGPAERGADPARGAVRGPGARAVPRPDGPQARHACRQVRGRRRQLRDDRRHGRRDQAGRTSRPLRPHRGVRRAGPPRRGARHDDAAGHGGRARRSPGSRHSPRAVLQEDDHREVPARPLDAAGVACATRRA